MRKLLLILALGLFPAGLFAQSTDIGKQVSERLKETSLVRITDDIGDFTITDSDGVTHNLYNELDAGNTVFIDLFFST